MKFCGNQCSRGRICKIYSRLGNFQWKCQRKKTLKMQDQVNVARLVIQKSLHLQSAQGHNCRRRSIIEKVIRNCQMNVIKCSRSELTKNKTSKVGNLLAGATQQKLLDCAIMNQFTLNMYTGNLKFFMEMKMQKGFLQTYLSRCMMQKSSHLWS